jgi:hypothetical protein
VWRRGNNRLDWSLGTRVASSWCRWAIAVRRKKIARVGSIAASDARVAFEVRNIAVMLVFEAALHFTILAVSA